MTDSQTNNYDESLWKASFIAGLGGILPTLCKLATANATNPEIFIFKPGHIASMVMFFIIGVIVCFGFKEKRHRESFTLGIAAPAIISSILSGVHVTNENTMKNSGTSVSFSIISNTYAADNKENDIQEDKSSLSFWMDFLYGLGLNDIQKYRRGTSLVESSGSKYDIDRMSETLREIIKNKKDSSFDNFIFYVHGRGKEPSKSLRDIIPELEKEYTAKVLMFHWFPSYIGVFGYPKEEAEAAAPDLGKALEYFQAYKDSHKDEFENIKTTMLVHSTGNIVFGKFMESYALGTLHKGLFDTIILNSADVDAKGHDKWVSKIDFTNNLYITLNEGDNILSISAKTQGENRLGQITATITGKQIPLAANAKYVDLSETGVNHRYFLKSGQKDNRWLKQFYEPVMNGNPVDLNLFRGIKGIETGNGNKIFVFKGE